MVRLGDVGDLMRAFMMGDELEFPGWEQAIGELAAFANLVPDEVHARLGREPKPWAERLQRFFAEDLVVRADGGDPEAISPLPPGQSLGV